MLRMCSLVTAAGMTTRRLCGVLNTPFLFPKKTAHFITASGLSYISQSNRTFSSKRYRTFDGENPYLVLGVPVDSSYEIVKVTFLKQAMKYHPDRSDNKTKDSAAFVRARHAFEQIMDDHKNGRTKSNDQSWQDTSTKWNSDDEFNDWFHRETTGHVSFSMCEKTRQEVIQVYKTLSHGGRDKGGYWDMARQIAERENVPGVRRTGANALLESGKTSTNLRRRRNR